MDEKADKSTQNDTLHAGDQKPNSYQYRDAFFSWDTLDPTIESEEHRNHFWSRAITTQGIEDTPKSYEMMVTECLWAQTFWEANAGDIGFASICYGDEAMAAAFDQRLKLIRTNALMKGDDFCYFRYVWEG